MITSAGMVKITPAAIDAAADAPVCTMLISRIVPTPSARSTAIDTTAAGIAAAIVIAKMIESTIARAVSCGTALELIALPQSWRARRALRVWSCERRTDQD